VCLTISIIWFVYRHEDWVWIVQNLMAISLALNALSFYRLSSYKTVTIILIVFFIYDVFMVFISPYITKGTSIMEAVAFGGKENSNRQPLDIIQFGERDKTDRLPVVIIIPRLSGLARLCSQFIDYPFSLLGLGDLLIPGLSVNYGILFDLAMGNKRSKVYFIANIIAYGVGLLCAFIALVLMNMAQPALLYLCPSHLIFTYAVALMRKEVSLLWSGKPVSIKF
jgi:signal peptide peptidase-like 2B